MLDIISFKNYRSLLHISGSGYLCNFSQSKFFVHYTTANSYNFIILIEIIIFNRVKVFVKKFFLGFC